MKTEEKVEDPLEPATAGLDSAFAQFKRRVVNELSPRLAALEGENNELKATVARFEIETSRHGQALAEERAARERENRELRATIARLEDDATRHTEALAVARAAQTAAETRSVTAESQRKEEQVARAEEQEKFRVALLASQKESSDAEVAGLKRALAAAETRVATLRFEEQELHASLAASEQAHATVEMERAAEKEEFMLLQTACAKVKRQRKKDLVAWAAEREELETRVITLEVAANETSALVRGTAQALKAADTKHIAAVGPPTFTNTKRSLAETEDELSSDADSGLPRVRIKGIKVAGCSSGAHVAKKAKRGGDRQFRVGVGASKTQDQWLQEIASLVEEQEQNIAAAGSMNVG
ncbi:hypothetical protein C8R46DRAFT_1065723 [Mycena filopes]|nr:hypothetical protein C8R46DRAFT_1065723 [Mycena filopes]